MNKLFRENLHIPRFIILTMFLSFFAAGTAWGQIRLPRLISDGMVLQREVPLKIHGWASPGEAVALTFRGHLYRAKTDNQGNWSVVLPPQQSGGPWDMVFKGKNRLKINDILVGDVWICSGQSNMVLPMERVKEKYPEEISHASYPSIRNFFIPPASNLQQPAEDLPQGSWKPATPENVLAFSAVAYFFAKAVYERYHIPIGLINASVGGTPIEAWISDQGLREFTGISETVSRNRDTAYVKNMIRKGILAPVVQQDSGLSGPLMWYDPAYVPGGWKPYTIPGYWADQGARNLHGVVWFRKEIEVPGSMTGVQARLFMGRIVDADVVYVNGVKAGNITYQYPPRRYVLPAGLLRAGKNLIVARVTNTAGKGGFVPDKPYFLEANGQSIDLRGEWSYKVGEVYPPAGDLPQFNVQYQPTALYNAMIAPLIGYPAKGFLWYQGESNTGNPGAYRRLMPALIHDWRRLWNQGELPFLFVQLANFMDVDYLPEESNWAELRDAQLHSLSVPRTAMAVTIDLGEWNDIHPLNKKDVGERLALGAFSLAYGDSSAVYSGPLYKSFMVKGDSVIVEFSHTGGGLVSGNGEPLSRFEISGADHNYVAARARIDGNRVIVRSKKVPFPENVRYAWADNPDGANLYNREGLPASPFRTSDPDSADSKPWHGKSCAVVLTYDDGLNVHLDHVIPLLDSLGFRATFYIPGASRIFSTRVNDWKKAAGNGHELGNHTLFHPCNGSLPGREWVHPDYDLAHYSVDRFMDEVKTCNLLLSQLDGKTSRTFAYPCGDRYVGSESLTGKIMGEFVAARGVQPVMQDILTVDLGNTGSYMINGESGEQMINLVRQAMKTNSLLVFLFHGVGGEHSLNVSLPAHRELLQFLKQHEHEIWVTPLSDAARHIRNYRDFHKADPHK